MNKQAHPVSARREAIPPYDEDAYGWAMAQARFLREQRLEAIDWENVAEEIESMGRGERKSAESQLRIVLMHRLKWMHQPTHRGRSWQNSIGEHLRRFDRVMSENPSLKPKLDSIRAEAYREARYEASQETGLDIDTFPEEPPSWDAIRGPLPD
jgi:hypothetical protein